MSPSFQQLLIQHALWALHRQKRFVSWLGHHEWQWQGQDGTLLLRRLSESTSEEIISCRTQALGSVSQMSETWTWIWANDLAELSEDLMNSALQLRAIGEAQGVPEFVTGEFPGAQMDAHLLALVAVGVLDNEAYYRGTYIGGAGFVLIESGLGHVVSTETVTVEAVLEVVQEVEAVAPLHQRAAIRAFLQRLDWQVEENAAMLWASGNDERIEFVFSDNDLLSAKPISRKI